MNRTFIIAEAGVNHNGELELAKELIVKACEAGADAIKFQTFKTELLVTVDAPKAEYQKQRTSESETQFAMLKRLELSREDHLELVQHCRRHGIEFMSTPFDLASLSFLIESCDLKRLKLSSGDLTNGPLLLACARTGLPLIISTGMATLGEVEEALIVISYGYLNPDCIPTRDQLMEAYMSDEGQKALRERVTILHCTTEYPTPLEDVNLRSMDGMLAAFGIPVGFSDHTEGIAIPIAAVARGAVVIEKHFTLDRSFKGPDHKSSLEPWQLMEMITSIRQVEGALGCSTKLPVAAEMKNREVARKSIVASRDISEGEEWTELNLTMRRPGTGLSGMRYWELIGRKSNKSYQYNETIRL